MWRKEICQHVSIYRGSLLLTFSPLKVHKLEGNIEELIHSLRIDIQATRGSEGPDFGQVVSPYRDTNFYYQALMVALRTSLHWVSLV